jgi:hypothetical protein
VRDTILTLEDQRQALLLLTAYFSLRDSLKMAVLEKMQEVKRPATAPTPKASEPVKTNVIKERPLSSGASDKKAPQPTQTVHRQNVEKVVSQETRQNDTKDRRIKVQQTQSVQKNQQTIEKTRNLVTKKGQKKK